MDEEVLITINGIDIYKNDYIYASHSANFIAKTKVKLIEVKDDKYLCESDFGDLIEFMFVQPINIEECVLSFDMLITRDIEELKRLRQQLQDRLTEKQKEKTIIISNIMSLQKLINSI